MDGHLLSVQYRIRQRVKTRPLLFSGRVRGLEDKGYSEYRGELKVFCYHRKGAHTDLGAITEKGTFV